MSEKVKKVKRAPKLWEAIFTLGFLAVVLAVGIAGFGADPHVPMFLGVSMAVLMAFRLGFTWDEIEKSMKDGVYRVLQALMILIVTGILIGVWIDAGVVPAMIYYDLQVLHPSIFLIATLIICSITSIATGTSWGTVGTVGIALLGIGYGLGINPGMTAGAIVSGAYFGDKMSPLSDTTNLAPAMAGTDVMSHIRFMMFPTGVAYAISLVFYGVLGAMQYHGGNADMSKVAELTGELGNLFNLNPVLLLPPIIVIVSVALKAPALLGLSLGIYSGAAVGLIFQPNCTVGSLFISGMSGFSCESSVAEVAKLLNRGGLTGMMFSVSMCILAMMFGGIMEDTRMMETIINKLKPLAKTPAALVVMTEITAIIANFTMCAQYIAIIVPGRMFSKEYEEAGLSPETLSNALESSASVTSGLIPWNTCGAFMVTTLGMGALEFAPWAVFCWITPIVCAVMAYMGLAVADKDGVLLAKKKKVVA